MDVRCLATWKASLVSILTQMCLLPRLAVVARPLAIAFAFQPLACRARGSRPAALRSVVCVVHLEPLTLRACYER